MINFSIPLVDFLPFIYFKLSYYFVSSNIFYITFDNFRKSSRYNTMIQISLSMDSNSKFYHHN